MRVLEVLDREGAAEGQDHRVPEHAQREQEPVGLAEVQQVAPGEGLGLLLRGALVGGGDAPVEPPVQQRAAEGGGRHRRRDQQRRLPALGVGVGEPGRRHVGREGAEPADGQGQPHRERHLAADEVLRQRRQRGDAEGLGADAEQQPAGGHAGEAGAQRGQQRAEQADGGGPQGHARGAEAVHQHAADEDQHDVGQAVDRVEQADLLVAEAALALQRVGDGADRVVDVVVAVQRRGHQGAHQPRDGAARGLVVHGRVLGRSLGPKGRILAAAR